MIPCVRAAGFPTTTRTCDVGRIEQQEHYKFPDVMFCTEFGAGCLNLQNECFDAGGANIFSFDVRFT